MRCKKILLIKLYILSTRILTKKKLIQLITASGFSFTNFLSFLQTQHINENQGSFYNNHLSSANSQYKIHTEELCHIHEHFKPKLQKLSPILCKIDSVSVPMKRLISYRSQWPQRRPPHTDQALYHSRRHEYRINSSFQSNIASNSVNYGRQMTTKWGELSTHPSDATTDNHRSNM